MLLFFMNSTSKSGSQSLTLDDDETLLLGISDASADQSIPLVEIKEHGFDALKVRVLLLPVAEDEVSGKVVNDSTSTEFVDDLLEFVEILTDASLDCCF